MSWPEWNPARGIEPSQWPLACIGPGRVGCALSRALAGLGFPVVAVGGGLSGWDERLAAELGAEVTAEPYGGLGGKARLILVTPPDHSLAAAAAAIGAGAALKPGTCIIQTSATVPAEVLRPMSGETEGIYCLSLHPLKPFLDRERGLEHFSGAVFGIEGVDEARTLGHALAGLLNGHPLDITPRDKAVYHAVGVMAFTGVMALAWAAQRTAEGLDLDPSFLENGILPNMSAAAEAVREQGLPRGLTGPISRGDADVVSDHMKVLAERFPELVPIYREIGLLNLRMVEEEGRLDGEMVKRLRQALKS